MRDELVASRRLSTFGVLTYLLVTCSPGGVSEKQNLLRNLEDPPEIQNECLGWPTCLETVASVKGKDERDRCNCS